MTHSGNGFGPQRLNKLIFFGSRKKTLDFAFWCCVRSERIALFCGIGNDLILCLIRTKLIVIATVVPPLTGAGDRMGIA